MSSQRVLYQVKKLLMLIKSVRLLVRRVFP